MKKLVFNPYLPLNEYIPDAEPRLFGERVYIYGSHDSEGGSFFCTEDYNVWSAPKDDLSDWKNEGLAYKRDQDPSNKDGKLELFAPDVVKGVDGKYYLYYCLRMLKKFGVAVSKNPQGPFEFYGHVKNADGTVYDKFMPYDPSVLCDEDGKVYLYYGFSSKELSNKFNTEISPGAMVVQLLPDMLTVCSEPAVCIPWQGSAKGTQFENHAYFEAPSIRKLFGKYYLVYSSEWGCELCYAVSEHPTKGFAYGGVLVDNSAMGENGSSLPSCVGGNNHGGLLLIDNNLYIFYHRHTHANSFSRQACAEKLVYDKDKNLHTAQITSCGLSQYPLLASGIYPSAIACCLYGDNRAALLDFRNLLGKNIAHITHDENGLFICNIKNNTIIGYKYFNGNANYIYLTLKGYAEGKIDISYNDSFKKIVGTSDISLKTSDWGKVRVKIKLKGSFALYIRFIGTGELCFKQFELSE